MDKQQLNKLVDKAMQSMDDAERAMPKPFLLTRIHARMRQDEKETIWDKAVYLLTRPAYVIPALALVLLLNIWMMRTPMENNLSTEIENQMVINDGYSLSTATTLFDFNNTP